MVIAGLTGSIGMGKSTAAALLRRLGVPVHDADAAVHRLLAPGGAAAAAVAAVFPEAARGDAVDRRMLGDLVFAEPVRLAQIERILHPLVRAAEHAFIRRHARQGARLVVLDIPLLYETGAEARLDAVIVVTASALLQRMRVLARPGMTEAKFRAIAERQVPDAVKRRWADYVVVSGAGRPYTLRALSRVARSLSRRKGRQWPPRRTGTRNRPSDPTGQETACGKSSSTPRPRAWTRGRVTGSWRSAASS